MSYKNNNDVKFNAAQLEKVCDFAHVLKKELRQGIISLIKIDSRLQFDKTYDHAFKSIMKSYGFECQ